MNKDNYHEQGNIIIILLLLPLGHISNRIGRYGVEDGGGWGFAVGGEGVFAPTEYEWGNGGRRGTKGEQCFGLRRACLKFGESYKLCPI